MSFPVKECVQCGEEFKLKPGKPGFANRCPECSEPADASGGGKTKLSADERRVESEANAARRSAIRDLLYRGDR